MGKFRRKNCGNVELDQWGDKNTPIRKLSQKTSIIEESRRSDEEILIVNIFVRSFLHDLIFQKFLMSTTAFWNYSEWVNHKIMFSDRNFSILLKTNEPSLTPAVLIEVRNLIWADSFSLTWTKMDLKEAIPHESVALIFTSVIPDRKKRVNLGAALSSTAVGTSSKIITSSVHHSLHHNLEKDRTIRKILNLFISRFRWL